MIPFMKVVDAEMLAFSQGVTRRGSYAAYLHMSSPRIEEFLDVTKPTGGDTNRKCTNLHHGVVVPDALWNLYTPLTSILILTIAGILWILITRSKEISSRKSALGKILQNRMETGEPYSNV